MDRIVCSYGCVPCNATVGTNVALDNYGHINSFLGVTDTIIETAERADGEVVDTEYYKSRYGAINEANQAKLIADTYEQVRNEAREGTVLMWNNNNTLPLQSEERSVTLFGYYAADPMYAISGSANSALPNNKEVMIDLYEALTAKNFTINDTVYNTLKTATGSAQQPSQGFSTGDWQELSKFGKPGFKELEAEKYDQSSWENNYNDVAIVVLRRDAGEGSDIHTHYVDDDGIEKSALALTKKEKDMLQMIKDSDKFGKVIVLLNSPWQMEVEELKSYGVDATLLIGTPGVTGFEAIVEILLGETNPSGRLVDTYATSSLSAPATANAAGNTPAYTNAAEIKESIMADGNPYSGSMFGASQFQAVSVQQEGIYIGYKYYETRYEDAILNRNGAKGSAGIFASKGDSWNYADEVSYPFGHGLSYTTFAQEITDVTYNATTDKYTVSVQVTNTGDVAGKFSVPVYAQTPYDQYEIQNGVEKAAVNLVGFGKTAKLAPDAKEVVKVEVDRYLLASYDANGAEGYIISGSTNNSKNYFAVGNDAHDALNNILAKKGATGMYDFEGNAVAGNPKCVYEYDTDLDTDSYKFSETGVRVTNQFEDHDINYWMSDANKVKYLTRSDWNGTFPTSAAQITATQAMIDKLNVYRNEDSLYFEMKSENGPAASDFTYSTENNRIDNGLKFVDMRNIKFEDDVNWDKFLDQCTLEELASLYTDQNQSFGIDAVALPTALVADGIVGHKDSKFRFGDQRAACIYTAQNILAGTFNHELICERGELMSEEQLFIGKTDNWGLGLNLHRTPFSGRNGEYVSECPNLTMIVGYELTVESQENGLIASAKHFAGNDQEHYRMGVSTFYTEQSFREGALRGFEGCLRFGGSNGTMTSMSRQGLVYTCSDKALMTTVLRDEWGFKGRACADFSAGTLMQEYLANCAAGTDQYCFTGTQELDKETNLSRPGKQILAQIEKEVAVGDGSMIQVLRENAKHSFYALSRSNLINGLDSNSTIRTITPTWLVAVYVLDAALAVFTVLCVGMLTHDKFFVKEKQVKSRRK